MIFFLDCSSQICFLLIKFHCSISISNNILQYYFYYYCIFLIGQAQAVGTSFFMPVWLLSTLTVPFLPPLCFSFSRSFRSCCSHARVFGKTLLHEFLFSCSHAERYLLYFARRHDRTGRGGACRKMSIIIIIISRFVAVAGDYFCCDIFFYVCPKSLIA